MKDIKVRTDLVDHLECDICRDDYEESYIFLLCRWDTENGEYYVSEILCKDHWDWRVDHG